MLLIAAACPEPVLGVEHRAPRTWGTRTRFSGKVSAVARLGADADVDHALELADGRRLKLSRRFRRAVFERLGMRAAAED